MAVDLGYDESGDGDALIVSMQIGLTEKVRRMNKAPLFFGSGRMAHSDPGSTFVLRRTRPLVQCHCRVRLIIIF
jgi:hypothetical protein